MQGFAAPKFARSSWEPAPANPKEDSNTSFFMGFSDNFSTFDLEDVDESVTISMIRLSDKRSKPKHETRMADSFKKELSRVGPIAILERNPSKDYLSPVGSP